MYLNPISIKFLGIFGILLGVAFTSPIESVKAQTCVPLKVIGGNGTKVKKTVSPLSTLVTNNNWNTDFAVPGGRSFNRYVATIVPENNANYDVKLNLKYSDNTSNESDRQDNIAVKARQPLRLEGIPRSQSEPFQVNVFVGGNSATGNTYTLSVSGCV
jgi:hypothetical protein